MREPPHPTGSSGGPIEGKPGAGRTPEPDALQRVSGYAHTLAGFVLFVGVALAIVGVAVVINQLTQPGGTVPVTIPDTAVLEYEQPEGLPERSRLDVAGALDRVDLHVAELPPALRALSEAELAVGGLLVLVAAILLRRVLLEIAAGRPFSPVVPRRLGGLAVTVLAMALLPQAAASLSTVAVLQHLGWRGEDSAIGFVILEVELVSLLVAAGLGISAAVFRHGQRLTEDVEGLV